MEGGKCGARGRRDAGAGGVGCLTLCKGESLVKCAVSFVCVFVKGISFMPTIAASFSKVDCARLCVNGRVVWFDICR